MDRSNNKVAVFILLGQSNAVGHGLYMKEEDKIHVPLQNVFGLSRAFNQSYDHGTLSWSNYTSHGMNLAEEQDDTYSVANCLAKLWQDEIDSGNECLLPDLYVVHIAIGAQGVTGQNMWNPDREKTLIPGKLGVVDISLYPFTVHILSLVKESISKLGKTPEIFGLHWRGGEQELEAPKELLETSLTEIYDTIFDGFYKALDETCPTVLHKIVCHERCMESDPSGKRLENMHYINDVFKACSEKRENITVFDVRHAPQFAPDARGNGIFCDDLVHFTKETNQWVAGEILSQYKKNYL